VFFIVKNLTLFEVLGLGNSLKICLGIKILNRNFLFYLPVNFLCKQHLVFQQIFYQFFFSKKKLVLLILKKNKKNLFVGFVKFTIEKA